MKKKEFAVGEVFQFGLKKLKVVEQSKNEICYKCSLFNICGPNHIEDFLLPIVGDCNRDNRSDGKSVMFVEVEEEE